ncbi:MAG: hypothetical protein H3C50_00030 [Kiritimatiellae bacterium]|nr:hypothetical protein [Kiritimatiellia bacterium]MCO5068848.1 hypothetical protein [Kiritimatiellia bacterium]
MRTSLFAFVLLPFAVHAATLSSVPMQGGMLMPMIEYDANEGRLHVVMPEEAPQLTPLLVSHPADSFSAGAPWFPALDPSAQGLSFSRRYGWVMGVSSDPLPDGTAIWIRKVASDPALSIYAYQASPERWTPILGTGGSSNALYWNGMMFHPAFTAPPGTNELTATFEAYLAEVDTGAALAGTETEPMLFRFTNVPDGRPVLGAEIKLAVQWDSAATQWGLEWATSITSTVWNAVTNEVVVLDGAGTALLDLNAAGRVFRMRRLP